jgi:hypothetical protein
MALLDRRVASPHKQGDPLLQTPITGPLLLDLLEWLAAEPRRYAETMDAWRTSCPRLPIWEEAGERGFVQRERGGSAATVCLTDSGRDFLRRHRP